MSVVLIISVHTKQNCGNKTMITVEAWTLVIAAQSNELNALRNTFYPRKKHFWYLFIKYLPHFLLAIGPCARSDWSKSHVLSEYKT